MRVLVIEPFVSGHHPEYLRRIVAGLESIGASATVALPEGSVLHDAYRNTIPVQFDGHPRKQLTYWKLFGEFFTKAKKRREVDLVFIPYLDSFLKVASLLGSPFGSTAWAGITMRTSFHLSELGLQREPRGIRGSLSDVTEKRLLRRLVANRHLSYLFHIDQAFDEYNLSSFKETKVVYLPDPSQMHQRVEPSVGFNVFRIPTDRKIVLVYGDISFRKGLKALDRSSSAVVDNNYHVVLAGRIRPTAHAWLENGGFSILKEAGRLTVVDRYINEEEEHLLFSMAAVSWLVYEAHNTMSGVLVRSAASCVPVISTSEGLIGWNTKRYGLGVAVDSRDKLAVDSALTYMANERWDTRPLTEYAAQHSEERFIGRLASTLSK